MTILLLLKYVVNSSLINHLVVYHCIRSPLTLNVPEKKVKTQLEIKIMLGLHQQRDVCIRNSYAVAFVFSCVGVQDIYIFFN